MPEKTLNLPLNGLEIRTAILDKISQALTRDCNLHRDACYDYIRANVTIDFELHDMGRIEKGAVDETVAGGAKPQDGLEQARAEFGIDSNSPNELRVETGQSVPTLAKDEQGRDAIRSVKYDRKTVVKK